MTKKIGKATCVSFLCVLLTLGLALSAQGFEVAIDVAPNVLNLESSGTVVTIHTDIAYSLVKGSSVLLNDVAIAWWKVDNQGNFVAKFAMDAIKTLDGLVIGGYNTLTLVGYTVDGDAFVGTQDIKVIDGLPPRR